MILKKIKNSRWTDFLFFILVSALVYLPRISEFTFFKDDWYFIFDGFIGGPQIYLDVALHTRPIRGYLYQFLFSLFEINPFPYHFLLFIVRIIGGLGAFGIFNVLWAKQRKTNLILALMTTIYPGFLWWTGGFEFQAYVISLGLGIFSILFTLNFLLATSKWEKVAWALGSFFTGWVYLALVEFAIGMEVFRFLAVYILISRQLGKTKFGSKLFLSFRSSAVFFLISISFIVWYQFFFDNWRNAQNAGVQLAQLFASPLAALWAAIRFLQSTLNVTFFAWITPFQQNYYNSRLTDLVTGLFFAVIIIFLLFLYTYYLKPDINNLDDDEQSLNDPKWQDEAFLIGILGVIGAVLPVILVNRSITFARLSHYALPASLAGSVFLGAIIYSIFSEKKRLFILSILFALATLTHHGAAANSISNAQEINEFWWQVTWRAPSISSANSTTLLVIYPNVNYSDGDEVAWAPANIIYYPQKQTKSPIFVPLSALRLEHETLTRLVMGSKDYPKEDLIVRNISFNHNYKNILILTQPSAQSCVHAIDNRWANLSTADSAYVIAGAQKSNIENIIPVGDFVSPPQVLFGPEPSHKWCYFYQKADLARQIGDWDQVIEIFNESEKNELRPNDQIELMPFLQAYAYRDDFKAVKQLSTRINTDPFYKQQACTILKGMGEYGYSLSTEMQTKVDDLFCP
ncbi:MAG: hypothetical protein HN736_17385 [Anaerolineae bacterium]|jgi:hypothetical protein|nr:hypothetical protein [Anaerolineae bacterium]MBT4309060.1 hypothetical protein [Anaerolineae bacterium]MBT4460028.1 hypothetical protein [Anaerolineae bacterium]MBT6059837.1 hypothetical protein [Anaerolineae bacterium]MBT6324100.1 hypothetical protein [Anaerolineae bacterium]